MPFITQICIVVVTIALVGVAVMAIRLMLQTKAMIQTANRSLAELPALIEEVKRTSARADEVLLACSQITQSARAGVKQFEGLATRSRTLASSLLDEIERPISKAVWVIRGIRIGADFLIQRWKSRVGSPPHETARKPRADALGPIDIDQEWRGRGQLTGGRHEGLVPPQIRP